MKRQETNKLFLSFGSFFSLANQTLFIFLQNLKAFFLTTAPTTWWDKHCSRSSPSIRPFSRQPPRLLDLSFSLSFTAKHNYAPRIASRHSLMLPPPVGLYPTFISVSVFPSIHLCDSSGGRRGFESLSVLPCEGESYGGFERESALLWVLYDISFPVRVTKEVHSPRSSLKTPALSYKVPSCIARTEQDGDPSGELVIKHLPLLNMSTHFHPNPLPPSRLTFSPHRRFVADWKEMKRRDMKRSFSSWSWTQSLSSLFFFFFICFLFSTLAILFSASPSHILPRYTHTLPPILHVCLMTVWKLLAAQNIWA